MRRTPIVLLAALALVLSGCTASDGDAGAARLAERVIIAMGDDITPPYPTPRPASYLAAAAINSPRLPTDVVATYEIDALSWSGNSGDDTGAVLEIRVAVHVEPTSATSVFGGSQREGDATRCWRLTVFGFHDYDSLEREEIECPTGPAPVQPTPEAPPSFPADVEQLLSAALAESDPEAAVRLAFPEEFYSIQSASENGETAIALGITAEGECAIGVIHADGATEVVRGFDPSLLEPGEMGCSPDLYFHPVVTH